MKDDKTTPSPEPWWKFGHVWLVIAGPCVVVVAGFVTAFIAMSSPDPVLTEDYYRRGVEIDKTLAKDKAMMPALQGRNHAATPAAAPAR
ncbi:MAG: FixH family protein [Ramlibacter sp.]|nr:FixH family protein [Ramlibacter sp.]